MSGVDAIGSGCNGSCDEVAYLHNLDARSFTASPAGREGSGSHTGKGVQYAPVSVIAKEALNEGGGEPLFVFHPAETWEVLISLIRNEASREVVVNGDTICKTRVQSGAGGRRATIW